MSFKFHIQRSQHRVTEERRSPDQRTPVAGRILHMPVASRENKTELAGSQTGIRTVCLPRRPESINAVRLRRKLRQQIVFSYSFNTLSMAYSFAFRNVLAVS